MLITGGIGTPVAWDGGLAAVGYACIEGETCEVVWTSPDGLTWSYTQLPDVTADVRIHGVVAGEEHELIVWGGDDRFGYFWTSSDGITWQRHTADSEVFDLGNEINELIWHDGILVGVGASREDRAPAIYRWNP